MQNSFVHIKEPYRLFYLSFPYLYFFYFLYAHRLFVIPSLSETLSLPFPYLWTICPCLSLTATNCPYQIQYFLTSLHPAFQISPGMKWKEIELFTTYMKQVRTEYRSETIGTYSQTD